jgi:hypothetical protein
LQKRTIPGAKLFSFPEWRAIHTQSSQGGDDNCTTFGVPYRADVFCSFVFVVDEYIKCEQLCRFTIRILPMGYFTHPNFAVSQIADTVPSEFHCFV